MTSKKNKVKKIKSLIILLLVILILLVIGIVIISNNPVQKNLKYIYNDKLSKDVAMPLNINKGFKDYRGFVDIKYIYKAMDVFAKKQVPKYYKAVKDLDDNGIKNYFNKNKDDIKIELAITNEEEFVGLANTLKKLNDNNFEFDKYVINPFSIKQKTNGIQFVLLIDYKDNNRIGVEINISNSIDKTKSPIRYRGNVDDELLEYEYSSGVENYPNISETLDDPPGKVIK